MGLGWVYEAGVVDVVFKGVFGRARKNEKGELRMRMKRVSSCVCRVGGGGGVGEVARNEKHKLENIKKRKGQKRQGPGDTPRLSELAGRRPALHSTRSAVRRRPDGLR